MKIHLIKTPDYNQEDYIEVLELLQSFSGFMQFLSAVDSTSKDGEATCENLISPHCNFIEKRQIRKKEIYMPADWSALFGFCIKYRLENLISPSDFVIILTDKRNSANWFSMFDGKRNAFIDCNDWDNFTDAASKFPIAYEVVANIFRTLMIPDFVLPNPYFHEVAKGCMNDLCMKKQEISLKLRTGDVCPICISRLNEQNIDDRILDQGISIFEGIRLQLLFREGSRRPRQLSEIRLTENNKFYFTAYGNIELKLFPLQKVLYAFYLNHLDGVRLNQLSDHKEEILYWYRKFSNADTIEEINERIDDLLNPIGSSFSQKKSSLNNKITSLLGEKLAAHYKIDGKAGEAFKINLINELVKLPTDKTKCYA